SRSPMPSVARPLLTVNEIEAYYGRVCALHSVSLEVAEGSVVALLGANGAGKTTTLRVISGLLRPTRGSVDFDGKRIDGWSPDRASRRYWERRCSRSSARAAPQARPGAS